MIALTDVSARARRDAWRPMPRLEGISLAWEKGVLAILGTPADGTTVLLEVLAGVLSVRAGRALIGGEPPASAQARVAYVPLDAALPDALRVAEVCELAGRIRGEAATTAASRLAVLGLEGLADRRVRSLSRGEARAVSLSVALTSQASVLLVEEPLAGLDSVAPARVVEALRARGAAGAALIVTTASVRDATALADQLGLLSKGVYSHLPASFAHVGTSGGARARVRVVVAASAASEVAPFVAALAEEHAVASVETAAFAATGLRHAAVAVVVTGSDLLAVARAVAAAASRTGANVDAIESAVMPLDAIRARLAAPLGPPPSPPPASVPPPASSSPSAAEARSSGGEP